ncbi:c-type cytochrome [Sphaerotilus sp.]|jgi:cytochrome c553|uniref:c-type cytochrome n=1 Tax=Sphaerotilus sp. TaxID=2093942 RepID=UPI0025F10CCC|nr:c-type cytochrome [Sphaerotilus sp.]
MSKQTIATAALALALAAGVSCVRAQDNPAGDAANGQKKAAMCIGCHGIPGYRASFPEIHQVPMISGQGAKYIASALTAYKKGERKHPTMRGIAGSLSDQDIADVAAFYASHQRPTAAAAAPAPSAAVAELLKKGNCASCHGEGLNKPIDASYPKLAGQHADYLYVALKSYKTENNPNVGRGNAIMGGMAKPFTNAELKSLADYIGSLPSDLQVVPNAKFR